LDIKYSNYKTEKLINGSCVIISENLAKVAAILVLILQVL